MIEKQFYRCVLCHGVVSEWDIKTGTADTPRGCPKCGSLKMSPSNLSWWEMIVQLFKHPNVLAWSEDQIIDEPVFPAGHTKKWTKDGPTDE